MVPRGRQIGFCLLHQLAVRIVGLLAVIAVYGIFAGALEYQTTDSPLSTAGARHLLAYITCLCYPSFFWHTSAEI